MVEYQYLVTIGAITWLRCEKVGHVDESCRRKFALRVPVSFHMSQPIIAIA